MNDERTEKVVVRVSEQRKKKWEEYAEFSDNYEVVNVSQLVRLAVEKQISGAYDKSEQQMDRVLEEITENRELIQESTDVSHEVMKAVIETEEMEDMLDTVVDELRGDNSA